MSYCRWSSDGFQCDVYVYASAEGWETHVALNRRPRRLTDYDFSSAEAMRDSAARWRAELDDPTNRPQPIGLPHDGESFCDGTPGECAERLRALSALGYNVPGEAIEDLLAEQAEQAE